MRNLILFGFLIMFLVAVQFASGQTVDEVIEKYEKALGGKDKLAGIKSIYMEGSREMMGGEVTVKIIKEQGKLSRTEFEMMGANGFFLTTEKEVWNYIPGRMEAPKKMPDEMVAARQTELDITGPLIDYVSKGHKAELIGKDSADGKVCFKIKLVTKATKEIMYWIDAETFLLVQSSTKSNGNMFGRGGGNSNTDPQKKSEPIDVFTLYKDYKAVDGILIPHSIETKMPGGGPGAGGTTFDKVEINKPVESKLYKPE